MSSPTLPVASEHSAQGASDADVHARSAAARVFHGLSEQNRLAILLHLQLGEHRVVDLTEHLGLSQSTVSQHLACLRDAGLVEARPVGRASVYRLCHEPELLAVLAAAERLLAAHGTPVELCRVHGG